MAILEAGGNAFDVAVATGFSLQVVEPHLNGPGGEVPVLFAGGGATGDGPGQGAGGPVVLSGQGVAPAGATIEAFAELDLDLVPGTGLLAATVPGAVCAWLTLLRDHGTQPLDAVLRFAIEYAETGHPLLPRVTETVASVSEHFRTHWPTSAAIWLSSDGAPPAAGRLFRNPVLASTHRRLLHAARGPSREAQIDAALAAWSTGFVAEAIDSFCRYPVRDDSGRPHPGFLTGQDLAGWTPTYEPPVTSDRQGWTLSKAGPWSQGPVLLQAPAMLDDVDAVGLRGRFASAAPDVDTVHVAVEAVKLAMADREAWYGDVENVPLEELLSSSYAAERRALIGDRASTDLRPGSPGGRPPGEVVVESASGTT
jgi:gamma-glutamyltranspeptidase/glutathione hydrolase